MRYTIAALTASVAPIALVPSLAQDYSHVPAVEVTQGILLEDRATPVEEPPVRIGNFETANTLPTGTFVLNIGTVQTDPTEGNGTGNQMYHGGIYYSPRNNLTYGLDYQTYEDPPVNPINGNYPAIGVDTVAGFVKYRYLDNGRLSGAVQGSVEFFRFDSNLFPGDGDGEIVGSVKAPFSYSFSPQLQVHLTPGVSVFPDELGGNDFYGIVPYVGAGVSYQATQRLAFYASVDMPFGSGGNTITDTAAIDNVPVWTAGTRWAVTPKAALDLYLTNGVGITPATSILTHWPDGDEPLFGVRLTYTPGAEYRPTYRGPIAPLTERQANLQKNGFTLLSADVIEPGSFLAGAWGGTDENYGGVLRFSPDRDGEIVAVIEQYADDGTADPALVPSDGARYMLGLKLRFLDQNNGDPLSLSMTGLFGRQIDGDTPGVGAAYVDASASYKFNDTLTVTASPKLGAFGDVEIYGLGLGVNYELFDGLELIAEATPVGGDGEDTTWAAGMRYTVPGSSLSVDLNASNAIGRYGIGTLIAQDSTRYSLGISTQFNLR
ncbi:hypothetical protein [Pseudoruegeria sp. HB172150]|uniref:hypothetical protein n=1 Tax=Pseudoruegeria sp. HB172150 TaxID=2721164 RepID=UPI0015554F7F|nr:hypothetical protein [Pseudoruegeria sp. HB172150]